MLTRSESRARGRSSLLITSPLIAAEIPKVPSMVRDPGLVSVMVLLDLPNKEYGINRVQDEVLAQLAGTNYEVFARLRAIPAMLIYVDAEALAVLERYRG